MDFTNRTDKATFFYSLDSTTWKQFGNTLQMSYDMPHFVGYRFGLFCYSTKSAGGNADFDWFQIGSNVNELIDLYPDEEVSIKKDGLQYRSSEIVCRQQPGSSLLTIGCHLSNAGRMSLSLFDARGSLVNQVSDCNQNAGSYTINHNISSLANGRYIMRSQLDGKTLNTQPVLIIK